jgi:hypothetical protein
MSAAAAMQVFLNRLAAEGHPGGPEPPPSVELFEAWLRTVRGPVGWGLVEDGSFEVHWMPGRPIPCLPRAVRVNGQERPIVVRVTSRAQLQGADEPGIGVLWGVAAAAGFGVIAGLFFALDKPAPDPKWVRHQRVREHRPVW